MAVLLRYRLELAGVEPLEVAIDDAAPLGPQIALARQALVPWKLLERATSLTERHLRNLMGGTAGVPVFRNDSVKVGRAH